MTTYVKRQVAPWQTCYADTYIYDDPSCFKRKTVYHTTPSIQAPSKNCVDSLCYSQDYIPKMKYCQPPGKSHHDAVSLNLGTFCSSAFTKKGKTSQEIKNLQLDLGHTYQNKLYHIQRGYVPSKKREAILSRVKQREDRQAASKKSEKSQFKYHNLILENRNPGCDLSSEELVHKKLTDSDKKKLAGIHFPAVWTTNTERAQLQSAIPIKNKVTAGTELEVSSDTIRYKADRYSVNAEPWQKFSDKWDNVQVREVNAGATEGEREDEKVEAEESQPKKKVKLFKYELEQEQKTPEAPPVSLVKHSEARHLPGYSGYVPRLPITKSQTTSKRAFKSEDETTSSDSRRNTTMQRAFPNYHIKNSPDRTYARRGVMSNTITLVRPHNPFRLKKNEIDCEVETILKKLPKIRQEDSHEDLMLL